MVPVPLAIRISRERLEDMRRVERRAFYQWLGEVFRSPHWLIPCDPDAPSDVVRFMRPREEANG